MTKIYFNTNYPKNLVEALLALHSLQPQKHVHIERTAKVAEMDFDRSVIFLFDDAKKKIEPVTVAHYDSGYRVFALRSHSVDDFDLFKISLTVVGLWRDILNKIDTEKEPFIYTYNFQGKALKKIV